MSRDAVYCGGTKYCNSGSMCGSGGLCLGAGEQDCGDGVACRPGSKCMAVSGRQSICVDKKADICSDGNVCTDPRTYCDARACPYLPPIVTYETMHESLSTLDPRLDELIERLPAVKYKWGLFRTAADRIHPALDHADDIKAALKIIAADWAIAVPGPYQLQIVKTHLESGLKNLMYQALTDIMRLMIRDVQELQPFWNDSSAEKEFKRKLIEELTKKLESIQKDAKSELNAADVFRQSDSSAYILFKPSSALHQLMYEAKDGKWKEDQCRFHTIDVGEVSDWRYLNHRPPADWCD